VGRVPRSAPSIAHVDLDAFFAAVEQRDKPSLRGKPVIVGGIGPRGVVSTASYEARVFGVSSAMATGQARQRCPHAAYLYPRFGAYRRASDQIMAVLAEFTPLIEPLSLDEAFLDLAAAADPVTTVEQARAVALRIKARIAAVTGGLTASAGVGSSKLMAKIASDLDKPNGLVVVAAGDEQAVLDPLPVRRLPGVGPATAERLRRAGVTTIADIRRIDDVELVSLLGNSAGRALARLAVADDNRGLSIDRAAKSVSVEDTYDRDITDPTVLGRRLEELAARVCARMRDAGLSGRTVTTKVRLYDFTTLSRSMTLTDPTDDVRVLAPAARRLLADVDTSGGVRLLGVGVSGLADWVQDDLFVDAADALAEQAQAQSQTSGDEQAETADRAPAGAAGPSEPDVGPADRSFADRYPGRASPGWQAGQDIWHRDLGAGWVWGSGVGRVTVRFETATSGPGPIRTFMVDDDALAPFEPWADVTHAAGPAPADAAAPV
jgi:DNA polymerase-4